ncbi:hypothetical protein HYU10_03485 [Candidatus Woesearchaeota archaeon]|nr:hypothetical protein [Candidatus Woesearchaeota archaeon]MBI2661088.1 hypothetical protein [Candidatus Woesearchaeota archaeon]
MGYLPSPISKEQITPDATVGYQGAPGAFSEEAILRSQPFLPTGVTPVPYETFEKLVAAVESGAVDLGMLPVYNTTHGAVRGNHERLFDGELEVLLQVSMPVRHCLIGGHNIELAEIKEAHSHWQALGQCNGYLKRKIIKGVEVYDTAGFIQMISNGETEPYQAGIAGRRCAELYAAKVKVLEEGIQDQKDNTTIFYAIAPISVYERLDGTDMVTAFMVSLEAGANFDQRGAFDDVLSEILEEFELSGRPRFELKEMEEKSRKKGGQQYAAFLYLPTEDFSIAGAVEDIFSTRGMPASHLGTFPIHDLRE